METWRPFTAFFRQAVLQKVLERWQEKKVTMIMNTPSWKTFIIFYSMQVNHGKYGGFLWFS